MSRTKIEISNLVSASESPKHIVCFGEVVWDDFPDEKRPGGSPGNFAYHCQQFGNRTSFISRVGEDDDGDELVKFLGSKGLPTDLIQRDPVHPTGKVLVHGPPEDPSYTIVENSAWDKITFEPALESRLASADAFCFATLTQRHEISRNTLAKILAILPRKTLRVLDINLRPPFYNESILTSSIQSANLIKLNDDELKIVGSILGKDDLISWLLDQESIRWVCLTKGEQGAELISSKGSWTQRAFVNPDSNGDSVGVGDAFLAALTSCLLREMNTKDALLISSKYASLVANKKGAMPSIGD